MPDHDGVTASPSLRLLGHVRLPPIRLESQSRDWERSVWDGCASPDSDSVGRVRRRGMSGSSSAQTRLDPQSLPGQHGGSGRVWRDGIAGEFFCSVSASVALDSTS
jgi:hypothetical protein